MNSDRPETEICVRCDCGALTAALSEIADAPLEAIHCRSGFPEFPDEVGCVEVDDMAATDATDASEVMVRLKPSDSLMVFIAALRALEVDPLLGE